KFDEHGGIKELPVPAGAGVILTEERAKRLCEQVQAFVEVFPKDVPLDVEWVLEGGQFWIVQARPSVGGQAPRAARHVPGGWGRRGGGGGVGGGGGMGGGGGGGRRRPAPRNRCGRGG